MKKSLLTFGMLLIALLSINVSAQTDGKIKIGDGPTMVFEKELHEYGTIEQNSNGIYYFEFTNTGSEPLVITNAKGSCGCTVPDWPREPIAPGATSKIKVEYDTKRIGEFSKSVTITSNATNVNNGVSLIKIHGIVEASEGTASPEKTKEGPVNN